MWLQALYAGQTREIANSPPALLQMSVGVLTETTAELALALTFAAARRVVEGDKFMRAQQYKGWLPDLFVGESFALTAAGLSRSLSLYERLYI